MSFSIVSQSGNYYFTIKNLNEPLTCIPANGSQNQKFCLRDNHIFSLSSGKILDSNEENNQIIISPKNKSPGQLWFFQSDGSIRNYKNECITLDNNNLYLKPWNCSMNQKWRIVTKP